MSTLLRITIVFYPRIEDCSGRPLCWDIHLCHSLPIHGRSTPYCELHHHSCVYCTNETRWEQRQIQCTTCTSGSFWDELDLVLLQHKRPRATHNILQFKHCLGILECCCWIVQAMFETSLCWRLGSSTTRALQKKAQFLQTNRETGRQIRQTARDWGSRSWMKKLPNNGWSHICRIVITWTSLLFVARPGS